MHSDHRLIKLDPREKTLHFANGTVVPYDHVISSIPLPELVPMIVGVPGDVLEASQRLGYTTCVVVTVGINRRDISEAHWTYFYDGDYVFTRVSFPHMFSPNNAPPGAGSIQAEVYYSKKYRPLERSPGEYIQPVLRDLQRCGLLREEDNVLFSNAMLVPYANVIYDLDRAEALAAVHGFLDDVAVAYCGRYGCWGYHWTDEAFMSGEDAAKRSLDRMSLRSR